MRRKARGLHCHHFAMLVKADKGVSVPSKTATAESARSAAAGGARHSAIVRIAIPERRGSCPIRRADRESSRSDQRDHTAMLRVRTADHVPGQPARRHEVEVDHAARARASTPHQLRDLGCPAVEGADRLPAGYARGHGNPADHHRQHDSAPTKRVAVEPPCAPLARHID